MKRSQRNGREKHGRQEPKHSIHDFSSWSGDTIESGEPAAPCQPRNERRDNFENPPASGGVFFRAPFFGGFPLLPRPDLTRPEDSQRLQSSAEQVEQAGGGLTADAVLAGEERLGSWSGTVPLQAWLMGIARHKVQDHCRARLRDRSAGKIWKKSHGTAEWPVWRWRWTSSAARRGQWR